MTKSKKRKDRIRWEAKQGRGGELFLLGDNPGFASDIMIDGGVTDGGIRDRTGFIRRLSSCSQRRPRISFATVSNSPAQR